VSVLADARFTGFEIERVVLAPGEYRARFQNRYAITIASSGSGRIRCDGERYDARCESGYVFGPGCLWTARALSTSEWRYQTLFIDRCTLRELDDRATDQLSRSLPQAIGPETLAAARRVVHVFDTQRRVIERVAALVELAGRLLSEVKPKPTVHHEPRVVAEARHYLLQHWSDRTLLTRLARNASLSRFHFLRIFQQAVGVPPLRYAALLRVAYAEQLLRDGIPIVDVADRAGYCDQGHLNRCFHRVVGMTPGQYQRATVVPERPVISAKTVLAYRFRNGDTLLRRWADLRTARAARLGHL